MLRNANANAAEVEVAPVHAPVEGPLFVREKAQWTKSFLKEFNRCFTSKKAMAIAMNDRGSINRNGRSCIDFTSKELDEALKQLDNQNTTVYSLHDETRLGNVLRGAGLDETEIAALKKSDILKLEAAIYYAYANLYLNSSTGKRGPLFQAYRALEEAEPDRIEEIQADQEAFRKHLIGTEAASYAKYQAAKAILEDTVASSSKSSPYLKAYGRKILAEVESLKASNSLGDLTETLKVTNATLLDPSEAKVQACIAQANKIIAKPSMGKILGGLLLGLAGAAIVVASLGVAAISFGLLAPVTVAGVTLGTSLITGAATVVAAAAGAGLTYGGGRFFGKGLPINKKPLVSIVHNLAIDAALHRDEDAPVAEQEQKEEEEQQQQQQHVQQPATVSQLRLGTIAEESDHEIDDEALADSAFGLGYQQRRC
jgi:hypothetical protein